MGPLLCSGRPGQPATTNPHMNGPNSTAADERRPDGSPVTEDGNRLDVEVLVIGAGITGIYQLYRAREAGFSVLLLEAGDGVGGTWYWNRYPGARFDSESYTYGYLFSKELFDEWEWGEHFAPQPETERYLNHVADRFDLRKDIRFGERVVSAEYEERSGSWQVLTDEGTEVRTRFLIAATGVLSVPYTPDVSGREDFQGAQYHTGLWPEEHVEFVGKRVAIIGTSSSGVQIVPAIADDVASVTVYQRTANWCTPLNNRPITADEQAQLRRGFERLRETLNTSVHGFHHPASNRETFDDTKEQRLEFYEAMWNSPGFMKLTSNYSDLLSNRDANADWCAFIADKIRNIVRDPLTAEHLIPKEQRFGEKRPPFVAGYYEAFNRRNVSLVDLRDTPILRFTPTGIETKAGLREFDIVVWATGFDFGTGALERMGIVGRSGQTLVDAWAEGPRTFLGLQTCGFPNLFFPGGPHAAAGNNPRYNSDQVDFVMDVLMYARDRGFEVVEVVDRAEERWTNMVDRGAASPLSFGESSYYFGTNIPGKPVRYLLNSGGRPKLFAVVAEEAGNGYRSFSMRKVDPSRVRTASTQ